MRKYTHTYLKPVSIALIVISGLLVLFFGWKIVAGLIGFAGQEFKTGFLVGLLLFGYMLYCSILCLVNKMPEMIKQLYKQKNGGGGEAES